MNTNTNTKKNARQSVPQIPGESAFNRRRWAARLLRLAAALVLIAFLFVSAAALVIYQYGQTDHAAPAQVIVVLGGGILPDGSPSPATARRAQHGAALYKAGIASVILCSGGYTRPNVPPEAQACADVAEQYGVPASAILREERSTTTEENAIEVSQMLAQQHFERVVLVSDCFHLLRSEAMFNVQGVSVLISPAQSTTGPLELLPTIRDTYREVGAFVLYGIRSTLGQTRTRRQSLS